MGTDVLDLEDAGATFERETKAWDLRLLHHSPRTIARLLGCTVAEANAAIAKMSFAVSQELRAEAAALILARLDHMQRGFYKDALFTENHKGNHDSAVIWLRGEQMRMTLLGLAAPPRVSDPMEGLKDHQTSTEQWQSAIDRLVGKTDRTIDGQVVEDGSDA